MTAEATQYIPTRASFIGQIATMAPPFAVLANAPRRLCLVPSEIARLAVGSLGVLGVIPDRPSC